eukprot:s2248_g20.t1
MLHCSIWSLNRVRGTSRLPRSVVQRSVWSHTREERYHRLQRELRHLGEVAELEDLKTQVPKARHVVESFLDPSDAEERGVAMLPGRARSVAGSVVEELQRGRQASQEGLRNFDRTEEELQELQALHEGNGPSGELVQRVPLTVLLDGLCPHEVGCLMRTCEAAGVQELLLCGETPGPPDARVLKTSLKAEEFLPHRKVGPLKLELERLEEAGIQTWTLEWLSKVPGGRRAPLIPEVPSPPVALALSADPLRHHRRIVVPCIGNGFSMGVIGSVVIYQFLRCLNKKMSSRAISADSISQFLLPASCIVYYFISRVFLCFPYIFNSAAEVLALSLRVHHRTDQGDNMPPKSWADLFKGGNGAIGGSMGSPMPVGPKRTEEEVAGSASGEAKGSQLSPEPTPKREAVCANLQPGGGSVEESGSSCGSSGSGVPLFEAI